MATKIVTKNSSTASAVPTASDLVQGELAVNVADKRLFTEDNAGAIVELGTNPTTLNVNGTATMGGLVVDANTATFSAGTSGDMEVVIQADTDNNDEGDSPSLVFKQDGGNTIGRLGLIGNANDVFTGSLANALYIGNNENANLQMYTNLLERLRISNNGDISFYEDTGTTAKLFWDASAESLGIGTSTPEKAIHVKTAVNNTAVVRIESTAADSYPTLSLKNDAREYQLTAHGPLGDKFTIYDGTAGSHRFVIDSAGNVGIGTSSPSSYQANADNLVVATSGHTGITIASGASHLGNIHFADGTTGDDAYRGFIQYEHTSNYMRFATNATERMRISSAGHTTFGTTNLTPADSAVNGTSILSDGRINHNAQSQPAAVIGRTGTDGAIADFRKNGTTVGSIGTVAGRLFIGNDDTFLTFKGSTDSIYPAAASGGGRDNAIDLGEAGTRFKDLYLSGNVNSSQLLMKDGTTTVGGLFQEYAITGTGTAKDPTLFAETGNGINFMVNGSATKAVRLDTSGNVGIGTSSATSIPGFAKVVKLEDSSSASYVVSGGVHEADFAISSTGGYLGTVTNAPMRFVTNSTERMRIDSSGNLLVGTTNSSQSIGDGTKIKEWGSVQVVNNSSTGGGDAFSYYSSAGSNYRFWVNANGQIAASFTSIQSLSDQRFKENIRDLDDGLSKVMQLKPRKFDWKEGKGSDIKDARGFIAQEFEEVFPDLIGEWKDPAPEGEEPYKSVSQDLIPTLVKAIQEQQTLIESLTTRIAALEE